MGPNELVFRQLVDDDLGCASYLVGSAGEAVVVDPSFEIERYLEAARDCGVRIARVLETHTHADHLSGHGRFALEHGLPVSVHPLAEATFEFDLLVDGEVLQVGDSSIRVLHTPGHRPEHCSFVVDGRIALTGDSLFVGDAARPDLAVEARAGARDLYGSLGRLVDLGDDVEVWPGHVAGSLCGGSMSSETSSTIGRERATNASLGFNDVQEFILQSAAIASPRPPTTERVVALNRGPWVALPAAPRELPDAGDATVLDVRSARDFGSGHLHGAFNVPVSGTSFGTKAAFVLDADDPVVLHASSREEAAEAARRLWAVGLFDIAGYVTRSGAADEALASVDVGELKRLLNAGVVQVVDVRETSERDAGYLPGSRHIPYRLLRRTGATALERDRPVVTVCESGARAAIAASILIREGFDARPVRDGGIADLAENETVTFRRCGG